MSPISGPDFLIIGAPRAGTSWLKRVLAHHPEIFMLAGEPNFFSRRFLASVRPYRQMFADGPYLGPKSDHAPPRRFDGEKSPLYMTLDEDRIAMIAQHFPAVRIICTIRDPVERALSHFDHMARAGSPVSIAEAAAYSRYGACLARWGRHFPAEQILLLSFDTIRSHPRAAYAKAVRHIGATAFAPDPASMKPMEPPAHRAGSPEIERELEGETSDLGALRAIIRQAGRAGQSSQ